ncbi:2-succinyl-5-enolpyruvyl-6-hydroxy-3-cyclohexene-1-carboxylic-acid synthase [Blattabacterium punctulatus]|uniref:2-succinyl-5-enolpyruvyl-6-hydroxy-3- cyclohexene-1-carboxylic-acid synthase n=1 Tax=Blattabacterium punctulatus TaxID=164514 RepID=UPI000D7C11D5|nr:2-succinyl-5-enolpyruvyl-6-hydroxy-3-cyclohexene-1-carboxylic-acid synthase [Blattabacterium punctulatus]AWU42444.1 2-succinyl-5-enolpyruvyl-6-hydroxy-3-cyclohexene-1-carboxylic-acid synthase [Blattabacterium punctulatus]AWU45724.1 2-succinyl-5-enolpyruvyl-6-hydroxy-3-cyclohexene-1-carboxylic-acid synthase [Blattabacterium punctulatus]
MYSNKKIVQSLGEILISKSIFHIIISPGSRNAPIIIHFTQHDYFKTYSIIDERCAGFFALGIAQKIKKPVVLSCTSGSSVVNYYPAVTEAFYQNIPLIFITADRPKKNIDILEGQSIDQENIFKNHVESSIQLTEEESKLGLWYNDRLINESINKCILKKKPIHINIPFSEPLYETTNFLQVKPKIIKTLPVINYIEKSKYYKKEEFIWKKSKKKMILLGLYHSEKKLEKILKKLSIDPSIVIFTETTSHVYGKLFFSCIDQLIFSIKNQEWINLKPNILLTIGGNIISKKIKFFLRKFPPLYHWHIGENIKNYPDTYYSLTNFWSIKPEFFFKIFHGNNLQSSDYRYRWEILRKKRIKKNNIFLKKEKSFSDLKVLFFIFKSIPKYSILQLGNSTIIRYYQLFDKKKYSVKSYCNRGTSGIDGCVSTAIGYAVKSKKIVTLIIGDISFFYDSNALWNNYTPNNFRIILINNGGGNIFRFLSEKKISKKIFNFFETKHFLTAKKICEMHNWKYEIVSDKLSLKNNLYVFWNKSDKPFLLEINTQKSNNAEILKKYLSYLS